MASRVLVTGASRFVGAKLCTLLAANPAIDRVIGVDTVSPAARIRLGRAQFLLVEPRGRRLADLIASAGVDTVVHARPESARRDPAVSDVVAAMRLLAACQRSATVRRLVLCSTTAVYGTGARDPALFTEDMGPVAAPRDPESRDAAEIEGYARGFARRRPDVAVALARLATLIGPTVPTPLVRYLTPPLVPTVFGVDPRLQFLHEDDAIGLLGRLALDEWAGVLNVAGTGVLLASQAIRRAGRVPVPILAPAVGGPGRVLRRLVPGGPPPGRALVSDRVVDTAALRGQYGFTPRHSTASAFDDFVRARLPAVRGTGLPRRVGLVAAAVLGDAPGVRCV